MTTDKRFDVIDKSKDDATLAKEMELEWVAEDKAKEKAREQAMIKRAIAQSEGDMQVEKKPSADDGKINAGVKLGLGRRNKAEPVDEYHPDDNKTKDGFYLKDSDDDEGDGNYSSYSDEYYDEVDGERENPGRHQAKRKLAKEDFEAKGGKLKGDADSKKMSI